MPDMKTNIQIKGMKDGLLVTLSGDSWIDLHPLLLSELEQKKEFLKGGSLVIDVDSAELRAAELGMLSRELSELGLSIKAVLSKSAITKQSARAFGLETEVNKPDSRRSAASEKQLRQDNEAAVLVRRTLRSGVIVEYPGHVVIVGDVNPGAQIIAAGDVVVWGKLRGVVHAGAGGNESAIVCALDLSPTQLRIAGLIAVTPKRRGKPQPETAHLEDGQVVAQTWDPKKEKL
jgi:septum site-determining protein MinC